MSFKELLVVLNNEYSGLLTVMVAVITALITLMYVIMTYQQVKFSKMSVESVEKQIKLSSQPCIIPKIIATNGTACFGSGNRRKLHIDVELINVGTSPAINIYTIGYFNLFYTKNENSDKVDMYYYPDYMPTISAQDKRVASISFEEEEIDLLIKDLEIRHELNIERLDTDNNTTQSRFRGTNLVIKIYYKNLLGQWFEATLIQEVSWLNDTSKKLTEQESQNVNEYTIPPKKLKKDTEFKLQLISERFIPIDIKLVDIEIIKNIMKQYENGMPEFSKILDNAETE